MLFSASVFAQVTITGGRIYLEKDGVRMEGYYNQFYTALAAAVNEATACGCTITIDNPSQTVTVKQEEPQEPTADYILIDNELATYTGDWPISSVEGYIGRNAVYSNSGSAVFDVGVGQTGLYEIEVHITSSSLRTDRALYEVGDLSVTINQQALGGWVSLGETTLQTDSTLTISNSSSGGSLVVDAIRYRLAVPVVVVPEVAAMIEWVMPTERLDGTAIDVSEINHVEIQVFNLTDSITSEYSTDGVESSYLVMLIPGKQYSSRVRSVLNDGSVGEWSDTAPLEGEM